MHNHEKNVALNMPQKGHVFRVWEQKQEGRFSPYSTSARNMQVEWQTFHCCACPCINDLEITSIGLGATNKLQQVGEFATTGFTNKEGRWHNYIPILQVEKPRHRKAKCPPQVLQPVRVRAGLWTRPLTHPLRGTALLPPVPLGGCKGSRWKPRVILHETPICCGQN